MVKIQADKALQLSKFLGNLTRQIVHVEFPVRPANTHQPIKCFVICMLGCFISHDDDDSFKDPNLPLYDQRISQSDGDGRPREKLTSIMAQT